MTDYPTQLKVVEDARKELYSAQSDEQEAYGVFLKAQMDYAKARERVTTARKTLHDAIKTLNDI